MSATPPLLRSIGSNDDVVWVVDDDRSIRWVLEKALAREGIAHQTFSSAYEVLQALAVSEPQVLVSDIRMPGESGLQLLAEVKERYPQIPIIIMTAYSDLDSAVAAFQGGAFEYLPKPFDVDHALALIRRAAIESRHSPAAVVATAESPEILGQAPAMQEVFRAIGRLAQSSATVLITGESGTGKELVARALHRHSPRAAGPFVAINTAAIPKDLLESELFGHERGAFTGAQTMRRGRFEQAEGGTLFLDEIGDMPLALQTRLLRVLAGGEFYRVGGRELIRGNVRIVAATHQDLDARVASGHFRADLKHRLDVVRIELPALRQRRADIPLLAKHFLGTAANEFKLPPKRLSRAAQKIMEQRDFPGNVRELENLCRRLAVVAPGSEILPADLGAAGDRNASPSDWTDALRRWAEAALLHNEPDIHARARAALDKTLLQAALVSNGGHRQQAAASLGVGRNTLTRKLGASRARRPKDDAS